MTSDPVSQRRALCEQLFSSLTKTLDALRDALDRQDDAATSLVAGARSLVRELETLLLAPHDQTWPDAGFSDVASLHAFRRAAQERQEALRKRYHQLADGPWLTATDMLARRSARSLALRALLATCLLAVLCVGWWQWQQVRMTRQEDRLNAAKQQSASDGVRVIAMAWAQAARVTGTAPQALADITPEPGCTGADLRGVAPDNPCRQAWMRQRAFIFSRMIPAPGNAFPPPSELLLDPWGSPYVLAVDGQGPMVLSPGPDGRIGTADDVTTRLP